MDVFITLLSLGVNGYKNLITQRKEMYTYLKEELTKVALKHGERLLETKNNPISLGIRCFNNNCNSYALLLIFKICFLFTGRC
jgi:O-phospho-L-seryl-tRNASec:L-selenocysteinyl-tRNA synthase